MPLVCRRWHRLGVSRDSAAWRGARLCCTPGDVDAARVLLHAPALQSLLILYGETPWGLFDLDAALACSRLRSALRRSRAAVRELRVDRVAWQRLGSRRLAGLVWRNRDHLRVLTTCAHPINTTEECNSEGPASIFDAIGQQRRLVSLEINDESWPAYKGELSSGPRGLRELRVDPLTSTTATAVHDLLRLSASSVQVLHAGVRFDALGSLRVGALPRLRDLGLRLHLCDDGYADEEAPQMVSKAISEAASVPGLRRLWLEVHNGHFVRSTAVVDQCNRLVDEFRAAAPTVEVDFAFWRLYDVDNDQ